MNPQQYFERLNQDYLTLYTPKERWFWTNYMGTTDDHAAYAAAETAYKSFIANPDRLAELRAQIGSAEALPPGETRDELLHGLKGWLSFFEVNAIESDEGRRLEAGLVEDDTALFAKRKELSLFYENDKGERTEGSTLVLSINLVSSDNERVRFFCRPADRVAVHAARYVLLPRTR